MKESEINWALILILGGAILLLVADLCERIEQ